MIDYSRPVRVFKNPKYGCYTIMQDGRVKASAKQVRLKEAAFTVRESGRQRMLHEQRRTIHAYIVGTLIEYIHTEDAKSMSVLPGRSARYNPYRYSSFVDSQTEAPLSLADLVQLDESGVTYSFIDQSLTTQQAANNAGTLAETA